MPRFRLAEYAERLQHAFALLSARPPLAAPHLVWKANNPKFKFFECAETNGLAQFRSHRQLEDAPFIEKLTFENKMQLRKCIDANYIQLSTFGNMSIWELKVLIAQHTNQSPINIQLKRSDQKKDNIKDSVKDNFLSFVLSFALSLALSFMLSFFVLRFSSYQSLRARGK